MIAEALAFLAAVVAVAAPLCGHQGQPWPLRRRAASCAPAGAPEGPSGGFRALRPAPDVSQPPSRPSWTRTDKDAA